MEKILISIVMPVYNNEVSIDETIKSIINQEYKNFELIIVDNGSKDKSKEIIKSNSDNRIKLYELAEPNVSEARNFGISQASGQYIMFIDADDTLEANALNILINILKNNAPDAIIFNYYKCLKDTKEIQLMPYDEGIKNKEFIDEIIIPDFISAKIWGSVWRLIIDKSIINNNQLRFNKKVKIAEDLLFNIELFACLNNVYILKEALYNYNVNYNSTLNRYKPNNIAISDNFHKELRTVLKKMNIYDSNIEFYKKNRIIMYTSSISNAVRNKKIINIYNEIDSITKIFKEDELDYNIVDTNFLIKLTLKMLQYKNIIVLMLLYKIKEIVRLRKCKK